MPATYERTKRELEEFLTLPVDKRIDTLCRSDDKLKPDHWGVVYPKCVDSHYHKWYQFRSGMYEHDGRHYYSEISQCKNCGVYMRKRQPVMILDVDKTVYAITSTSDASFDNTIDDAVDERAKC